MEEAGPLGWLGPSSYYPQVEPRLRCNRRTARDQDMRRTEGTQILVGRANTRPRDNGDRWAPVSDCPTWHKRTVNGRRETDSSSGYLLSPVCEACPQDLAIKRRCRFGHTRRADNAHPVRLAMPRLDDRHGNDKSSRGNPPTYCSRSGVVRPLTQQLSSPLSDQNIPPLPSLRHRRPVPPYWPLCPVRGRRLLPVSYYTEIPSQI